MPKFIERANLPKHICNHLLGREHSHAHRMTVGGIVLALGTAATQIAPWFDWVAVQIAINALCCGIQSVGTIPFAEALMARMSK